MKLSSLIEKLGTDGVCNFHDVEITGITHDSRKVKPGYLFVAIRGHKIDGHHFIETSIRNGAVAFVSEKRWALREPIPQIIVCCSRRALSHLSCCFYGNPSRKINVIGITGTNGKTTTAVLLRSIIESDGYDTGLIGTICYHIGKKKLAAQETTPESVELHRFIAEMVASRMRFAVMEVSSHSLVQHRVKDITFKTAVFTNISSEHLDYHDTISSYMGAKIKLFEGLRSSDFAVLNADDERSRFFAEKTKAQIIRFGTKKKADVKARICHEFMDKTVIRLRHAGVETEVVVPFIGLHNVYNVLASAAAAVSLGFDLKTVKKGIETAPVIPGRLEKVSGKPGVLTFVDYAHTPHALQVVLCTLKKLTHGRLILVFGCGGDRDREKRPLMGSIADLYSDIFWITNDNPRTEKPVSIIDDIKAGISSRREFHIQADRQKAIGEAIDESREGDIVLVAGKGHEQGQILGNTVIPFDDKKVIQDCISGNA